MHPGLPRQQRERFTAADHGGQLIIRHLCDVGLHSRGIVKQHRRRVVLRHRENVRDVELVRAADLDPDGPDHDEAANPLRRLGGHLGRDPAPDRASDHIDRRKVETVEQFQIEVRDIIDAVEPVRQARFAETGVGGNEQPALPGQRSNERLSGIEALTAM
jgi:hypothetical protein